jgi:hypothetical protein
MAYQAWTTSLLVSVDGTTHPVEALVSSRQEGSVWTMTGTPEG